MKRISQKELVNRIYKLKKEAWLETNTEELTTGKSDYSHPNRYDQSADTLEFKPFFMFNKFDPLVNLRYLIKRDVSAGKWFDEYLKITDFDYFVVRGTKYYLHKKN